MLCFQNIAFPFITPHRQKTPLVFCLPIVWRGGGTLPTPYYRSFNNLFITIFLFIIHFVFLFYFKLGFFLDQYSAHQSR